MPGESERLGGKPKFAGSGRGSPVIAHPIGSPLDQKVRIATAGNPVLYAMPEFDAPEAKTMLDWVKAVDNWRDMKPVEMVEAGYNMECPPN